MNKSVRCAGWELRLFQEAWDLWREVRRSPRTRLTKTSRPVKPWCRPWRAESTDEIALHLVRNSGDRVGIGCWRRAAGARHEAGGRRARCMAALGTLDGDWPHAGQFKLFSRRDRDGGCVLQSAVFVVVGRRQPGRARGRIADVYRQRLCGENILA